MEVVWDLDTELKAACEERGMTLDRVPTVGLEQAFAAMVVTIAEAVVQGSEPTTLSTITVQGCTVNGAPCAPDCCTPVRRPAPKQ